MAPAKPGAPKAHDSEDVTVHDLSDGGSSEARDGSSSTEEGGDKAGAPTREAWPGSEASAPGAPSPGSDPLPRAPDEQPVPEAEQRGPALDYEELGRRLCGEEPEDLGEQGELGEFGECTGRPGEASAHNSDYQVPGFDELLKGLDEDDVRDLDTRAAEYGIPVMDVEGTDALNELLRRLDGLSKMTFSQLRGEYESRGFATPDSLMSRSELLPCVRDALIWEVLTVPGLVKVCKQRGIEEAHAGLSHAALLHLLARPSWEAYGVPAERFEALDEAQDLLGSLRGLETRGRHEILRQCRQRGLPAGERGDAELLEQLKRALVWSHLPEAELDAECRSFNLEPPTQAFAEELGCTRKEALVRRLVLTFWGAWGPQLERAELGEAFVKQFERLDGLSSSSIQDEYNLLNLYVHPELEDRELLRQLKQATIWKHVPLGQLRHECAERGLPAGEEDDSETLQLRLLRHDCVAAWHKRELAPASTFDHDTAVRIMQQWKDVERMTLADLRKWYKSLGFPEERDMVREHFESLDRKISTWQELSLAELKKECQRLSIDLPEPEDCEKSQKQALVDILTCRDRLDTWDAKGFQASRISDFQTALRVVEEMNVYSGQPTQDLRQRCKDLGVPPEAIQDRRKVLETLRTLLIWALLPLEELKQDCGERGLPPDTDGLSQEDARNELYQRLRVDLSVRLSRATYDEKGIPVERLTSLAAEYVLRQYESIEGQSEEELRSYYTGLGFPAENAMNREELVKVAKQVSLWLEMEIDELQKECEPRGVKLKEPPAEGGGTLKERLVDALLVAERMETWEARGFQSKAVGDFDKVAQIVSKCEDWQKMDHGGLKKALKDAGYLGHSGAGHVVLASLERSELLKVLKAVLIWELLPVSLLKEECKTRHLPAEISGREEQIRWLVRSTFANTWAFRGVPAERLGDLEVAEEIIKQVDKLQTGVMYHEMVGQGQTLLKEEYKKWKLPFDQKLDNQALLDRLRDLLVWDRLPTAELQRECRAKGVSADVPGLHPKTASVLAPPAGLTGPPGALKGRRPFQASELLHGKGKSTLGGVMPKMAGKGLSRGLQAVLNKSEAGSLGKVVKATEALGRMAQTKENKEEEEKARRTLLERLVLATWTSTWKPRGIPADRLGGIATAESLMKEVDRLQDLSMNGLEKEFEKVGVVFNPHCDREVLIGRLRSIIVWQAMPEAELRREHRSLVRPRRDRDADLDRGELMEQLLEHTILLESEAQGVPVMKMPDHGVAFSTMEGIDQSSFETMKEWYEGMNLPWERCIERPELVKLAKLLSCWQELPMDELRKECERYELKPEEGGDSGELRQQRTEQLFAAERLRLWDSRGYQAKRIGDFNVICQMITIYQNYEGYNDEDLKGVLGKMDFDCEGIDRKEQLRMMKTMLVWENLSMEEAKKECQSADISTAQVIAESGENQEELLSELVHLLKIDMRVQINKDSFEKKGIPVQRLGSIATVRVASHVSELEARSDEDLENEYASYGFSMEEPGLNRQHILGVLKKMVIWELLPLTELEEECKDRNIPLDVGLDPQTEKEREQDGQSPTKSFPKRAELIKRLTIDLHVTQNKKMYIEQGVPVNRLGSQKAYSVLMKFEEFGGFDIDALRGAQQDFNLPPAPNMPREELLSRIKDATIWKEFSVAELDKECKVRILTPLMPAFSPGQPKPVMRDVFMDTLLLHRCAKTYDEMNVPYKQLKTAKAAVRVLMAYDDLEEMTLSEIKLRYTSHGLSANLLENKEIKERLKMIAVYREIPMEDLRLLCAARHVAPGTDVHNDLVRRLVKVLWPPKEEPPKPKPKPTPKPKPMPRNNYNYRPPPPPRQPSMATGRMRLAQYFQVLQLPPSAGIDDVKKAYRRLALKHHPDKNRGDDNEKAANQMFQKVAEAYEKLSEFFLDNK